MLQLTESIVTSDSFVLMLKFIFYFSSNNLFLDFYFVSSTKVEKKMCTNCKC